MLTRESHALTASENIDIGDASDRVVGTVVLQVKDVSSWVGSIQPVGRLRGATDMPWVDLPYQNLISLADVAASTPITAAGIYAIRADGLEVELQYTHTSGSGAVAARVMEG